MAELVFIPDRSGSMNGQEKLLDAIWDMARKLTAALASPYVAKFGKLIAGQKNHENTGLTTLTYAAPVVINGETVNVGVVIQFQANGRPRAVNVGLQTDGVFKIDMKKAPKGLDSRISRYGQGTTQPAQQGDGHVRSGRDKKQQWHPHPHPAPRHRGIPTAKKEADHQPMDIPTPVSPELPMLPTANIRQEVICNTPGSPLSGRLFDAFLPVLRQIYCQHL